MCETISVRFRFRDGLCLYLVCTEPVFNLRLVEENLAAKRFVEWDSLVGSHAVQIANCEASHKADVLDGEYVLCSHQHQTLNLVEPFIDL